MTEDDIIRDELERLARAHMAASLDFQGSKDFTDLAQDLEISSKIVTTLRLTMSDMVRGNGYESNATNEQTALVSVPMSISADFLFRLEDPIADTEVLENILQVPRYSLQTIHADRTGDEGEKIEQVEFVFIMAAMKETITAWIMKNKPEMVPLFVKLAKTAPLKPACF